MIEFMIQEVHDGDYGEGERACMMRVCMMEGVLSEGAVPPLIRAVIVGNMPAPLP